jgi:hypothetical protein
MVLMCVFYVTVSDKPPGPHVCSTTSFDLSLAHRVEEMAHLSITPLLPLWCQSGLF